MTLKSLSFTKLSLISAATAALVMLAASPASAGSIAVNVGPNNGTLGESSAPEAPENNELPSDTSAGVVPQMNWNNLLGGSFPATQLTDDSGSLLETTSTVSTQWLNGVQDHGTSDGDQILMNGGLDSGGGILKADVVGIPYAEYDVYIYFDGGSALGRGGAYSVLDTDNGDEVLAAQDAYDTGTFSGTYILGNDLGVDGSGLDGEGNPIGSNYVHFTGLTAPNIRIQSEANRLGNPDTPRAPWNGFQIVEVITDPDQFRITVIDYSPADDMLTLTWTSDPDDTYIVRYSRDLDWGGQTDGDLGDGILADAGPTTTKTFDLGEAGLGEEGRVYFRVEREP